MAGEKILIVDDDPEMLGLLTGYLSAYSYTVESAVDGSSAIEAFKKGRPDLVVLDVDLPQVDGLEVCRKLRSESWVPILMLSAYRDDYDKIVGLEVGADDYLSKPCNPRELVARIRALLRRSSVRSSTQSEEELVAGQIRLHPTKRLAWQDEIEVNLTPTEYSLLELLARSYERAVARDELVEAVWGPEYLDSPHILDTHVRNLRRKLSGGTQQIEVVRGVGFKLI